MAKIISSDDLVVASNENTLGIDGNIYFDCENRTFELTPYLSLIFKDGVSVQALYSKMIDLWVTREYNKYHFPMTVVNFELKQYIFGQDPCGTFNGWRPKNDLTRQMIRDANWLEYSNNGQILSRYSLNGI